MNLRKLFFRDWKKDSKLTLITFDLIREENERKLSEGWRWLS
jgi:hypothetical protein